MQKIIRKVLYWLLKGRISIYRFEVSMTDLSFINSKVDREELEKVMREHMFHVAAKNLLKKNKIGIEKIENLDSQLVKYRLTLKVVR